MPELSPEDERAQGPQIIPLRFWKDHEPIDDRGNFREVDWVEYAKKGTSAQTNIEKVARIQKSNPVLWETIEPSYNRFLKGQEDPVDGTPLAAWPGVTRGQVDQLRFINLRSVEDVANATESTLESIGPGARALKSKAAAYVQAKGGRSELAEELAKKDAKIDSLTNEVSDLRKTLDEISERMNTSQDVVANKQPTGRSTRKTTKA